MQQMMEMMVTTGIDTRRNLRIQHIKTDLQQIQAEQQLTNISRKKTKISKKAQKAYFMTLIQLKLFCGLI